MMSKDFYRKFEDRYRGTRELIKGRLRFYLPYAVEVLAWSGGKGVLDLGCGRGEWLELLRENGYAGTGVDLDAGMLSACQDAGLSVFKEDVLAFLRRQPDSSLAVISAFHLVEHLKFDDLLLLVAEVLRVLIPGGLLFMETPNPENIEVGSKNFYNDPTHERPLPPILLSFIAEYAGFFRAQVVRLQESEALKSDARVSLLDVFTGVSPDYAVVAQKMPPAGGAPDLDELFSENFGLSLAELARRYDARVEQVLCGGEERSHMAEVRAQQAEARAQQAEARAQQAEARAQQAEARAQQSDERTAQLEALVQQTEVNAQQTEERAQQAEVRAQQAEVRAQQAEVRAQQAEVRAQQAEVRAQQKELCAQQSDWRAQQAELSAQKSEMQAQQAEARVQQAEHYAQQAVVQAREAEHCAEQAEVRTQQAERCVEQAEIRILTLESQRLHAEERARDFEVRLHETQRFVQDEQGRVKQALDVKQAEIEYWHQRLLDVHASTSWQLMKPLRAAKRLICGEYPVLQVVRLTSAQATNWFHARHKKLIYWMLARPAFRSTCCKYLKMSPWLYARARRIALHMGVLQLQGLGASLPVVNAEGAVLRSREDRVSAILAELEEAISQHKRGKNDANSH